MKTLVVGKNDYGQRLDKFLQKNLPHLPTNLMNKYIRKKRIKLNGRRCYNNIMLNLSDMLELFINDEFFEKNKDNYFIKCNIKLDVVYEDKNIIIVNKAPEQLVHEDKNEEVNTLINAIKLYLYNKGEYDPENENSFAPALCHRIDRNTSGMLIAAKNAQTLRIINEKIKKHEIIKTYICIAHGVFKKKQDILTGYLFKDFERNEVKVSNVKKEGYKYIETEYKVLKQFSDHALTEVNLITGRTHQIRAHLAHIGHAIVGDSKYGFLKNNIEWGFKYQALCAYKLEFSFNDDSGYLGYLNRKSDILMLENIWFFKKIIKKNNLTLNFLKF